MTVEGALLPVSAGAEIADEGFGRYVVAPVRVQIGVVDVGFATSWPVALVDLVD